MRAFGAFVSTPFVYGVTRTWAEIIHQDLKWPSGCAVDAAIAAGVWQGWLPSTTYVSDNNRFLISCVGKVSTYDWCGAWPYSKMCAKGQ